LDRHREVYGGGDERGIKDALTTGNFGQVLERTAIKLAEIAPVMAMSIAMSPWVAGGEAGISSGFEKYNQLQRSAPDASKSSEIISAVSTGVINAALIALSSKLILKNTMGKTTALSTEIARKTISGQLAKITAWSIPIGAGKSAAVMTTKSLIGVSTDYLTDVALGLREYNEIEFRNILIDSALDAAVTGAAVGGSLAAYGYWYNKSLQNIATKMGEKSDKVRVTMDQQGKTTYSYRSFTFDKKADADFFKKTVDATKVAVDMAKMGATEAAAKIVKNNLSSIKAKYPSGNMPESFTMLNIFTARLADLFTEYEKAGSPSPNPKTAGTGKEVVPTGKPTQEQPDVPTPPTPPTTPAAGGDIDPTGEEEILRGITDRPAPQGKGTPLSPAPKDTPVSGDTSPTKDVADREPLTKEEKDKTRRTLYAVSEKAVPSKYKGKEKESLKTFIKESVVRAITGEKEGGFDKLSPEMQIKVNEALSVTGEDGKKRLSIGAVSKEINEAIKRAIETYSKTLPPTKPADKPAKKTAPAKKPKAKPKSASKLVESAGEWLPEDDIVVTGTGEEWEKEASKLSVSKKETLLRRLKQSAKILESSGLDVPPGITSKIDYLSKEIKDKSDAPQMEFRKETEASKPTATNVGYNSHGKTSSWSKIKNIETTERGNYSPEEVKKWEKKYGLEPDTPVVWITASRQRALSYDAQAGESDKILNMSDEELDAYVESGDANEPVTFDLNNGRIIVESNDGDDGYLFVPGSKATSEKNVIPLDKKTKQQTERVPSGASADISPSRSGVLPNKDLINARTNLEKRLDKILPGKYIVTNQKGLYTDFVTNEITIEPSFRVELNSYDHKDINAFMNEMVEYAKEYDQQSFFVSRFVGDIDGAEFGTKGANGGTITPAIYIEFDRPLTEQEKIAVVKMAGEKGLAGLSIHDNGLTATAYNTGDLYGEEPQDFYESAGNFAAELQVQNSAGVQASVRGYSQEFWAYTAGLEETGAGSYGQLQRNLQKVKPGESALAIENTKGKPLVDDNDKPLTGKRLAVAKMNNALAAGGLKPKSVEATIKIITDVIDNFTKGMTNHELIDQIYEDYVGCVQYVDESLNESNVFDVMSKIEPAFTKKGIADYMAKEEGVRGSVDTRKLILQQRNSIVGQGMARIIVYETIQNSVDAGAKNIQLFEVKYNKELPKTGVPAIAKRATLNLKDKVDYSDVTQVFVIDDGSGMSTEDVKTKLLRVGNKGKGHDKAGAFGIAKTGFILGAERFEVVTVKDGVLTRLDTNVEEYLDSMEPNGKPIPIHTEKTRLKNGTLLNIVYKASWYVRLSSEWEKLLKSYSAEAKISLKKIKGDILTGGTVYDPEYKPENRGTLIQKAKGSFDGNEYELELYETPPMKNLNSYGEQEIYAHITTHGVPVYTTVNFYGIRWFGKSPVDVYLNFTKVETDPDKNNYPFIYNRTALSEAANDNLKSTVIRLIEEEKQKNIKKAGDQMVESIAKGIKLGKNTLFVLPGRDNKLTNKLKKHIKEHEQIYSAFDRVIGLYQKHVGCAFKEPSIVGIGYEEGVGGWRPTQLYQHAIKEKLGKEFFAVNLFNSVDGMFFNRLATVETMMQKDSKRLLASMITTVCCHEACHTFGSDESAAFSNALTELPVVVGFSELARFEKGVYHELFESSKKISIDELVKAGREVAHIFGSVGSRGGSNESRIPGDNEFDRPETKEDSGVSETAGRDRIPPPFRNSFKVDYQTQAGQIIKGLAYTVDGAGQVRIAFGKDLDATTGLHEFAHSYEKLLTLASKHDSKKALLYSALSRWLGATPYGWNSEQRERFVSGFMTHIYKGVTKGGDIGEAYNEMQGIISSVWSEMSSNPALDLDPETSALYDVILGVKDISEVFPEEVKAIARAERNNIIPNGTRGSPDLIGSLTAKGSKIKMTPGSKFGSYRARYSDKGRPIIFGAQDHGDYLEIDGMNCHNHAEVTARIAQIIHDNRPYDMSTLDFQMVPKQNEQQLKLAEEAYLKFEKDVRNHYIQLINSLKGRFDLPKLRNSLMNVISDAIIIKNGIDPECPGDAPEYWQAIKDLSGYSKLGHCTTLKLVEVLGRVEPKAANKLFDNSFFDIIPTLVTRMQDTFNNYTPQGEEEAFEMIGALLGRYSEGVVQSSKLKLNAFRSANVLVAKLGAQGKEVLSKVATGKNWSERMAGHGSKIIYEIRELFRDYNHNNKLGEIYFREHQKIAGKIVKSAIETDFEMQVRGLQDVEEIPENLPPLTEEEYKAIMKLQNDYIRGAVQENNRKVKAGESPGRIVHPDDVVRFKELMLDFNSYYEDQIKELNSQMGMSVIGLRKNYIMNVLDGIASTAQSGLVPEKRATNKLGDLLGDPPWIKTYEGAEGMENTDYLPILTSYNASMSKYIAFYPTIYHVNNVLPLKVPQTFNTGYEEYLYNFLKGIMGYAPPRRHVDKLISLVRTNVTSTALSWNPTMIALNFIQRHLSAVFVNPTVWAETNKMVNLFSGRLRNNDKYPRLAAALTILQTGGKNLYEEEIEKWRRLDVDKELSTFIRVFKKTTRPAEINLQNSGFMATERGNWGFAYTAGILQAAMSSKEYVSALKAKKNKAEAIEAALNSPFVFRRALVSGMVVNASTNCDPSAVFSPQYFTKNNIMSNLLWFLRFGVNHAMIVLNDANPFVTNKSNWSPGIFKSVIYGDESQEKQADKMMVMNNIVEMLSPKNMRVVYESEDKLNNRYTEKDMARAYGTAKKMRDEFNRNLNKPQHDYFRLSGKRIVLNGLGSFMLYTMAEFLIIYWAKVFAQWRLKNIGKFLLPEKAADRKIKQGGNKMVQKAALSTGNVTRFVTSPQLGSGLFPNINQQNITSSRAWTQAMVRYGTSNTPLGVASSIMDAVTGVGVDEMILEQVYKDKK